MITRTFLSLMMLLLFILTVSVIGSPQHENVTINFANMSPHLNQNLYLRVVDKSTLKETDRTFVLISAASFSVTLPAVDVIGFNKYCSPAVPKPCKPSLAPVYIPLIPAPYACPMPCATVGGGV